MSNSNLKRPQPSHLHYEDAFARTRTKLLLHGRASKSVFDVLGLVKDKYAAKTLHSDSKRPLASAEVLYDRRTKSEDFGKRDSLVYLMRRFLLRSDILLKMDAGADHALKNQASKQGEHCARMQRDIGGLFRTLHGLERAYRRSSSALATTMRELQETNQQSIENIEVYKTEMAHRRISILKLSETLQYFTEAARDNKRQVQFAKEELCKKTVPIAHLRKEVAKKDQIRRTDDEIDQLLARLRNAEKVKENQPFSTSLQNRPKPEIGQQPQCTSACNNFDHPVTANSKTEKSGLFESTAHGSKGLCETCLSKNAKSLKSLFPLSEVDSKNLLSSKIFKEI